MHKTLSVFGGEILLIAVICLLTLLLIPLLINSLSPSHPDDQPLIDNYVQHRDEFNRLAQMLTQRPDSWLYFQKAEIARSKNNS